MSSDQTTNLFNYNFMFLNIFGIWGGRRPSKLFKYFSAVYLFVTFFCYNILLTINLIFTPRKIELIIQELIFYFTEITVALKVLTILIFRDEIIETLDIIDCDNFMGDYENKEGILQKAHASYKLYWKLYFTVANIAYASQVIVPIFLIRGTTVPELPICKYYFLSDEDRQTYYIFWFIYQSLGMFGHMIYNVNIDSFVVGLLVIAISQLRLINTKLRSLKSTQQEKTLPKNVQDTIFTSKLNSCLRQYDTILVYHKMLQKILSTIIFFQYGVASIIICVVMCGYFLPASTESKVFLVIYLFIMTSEIFIPAVLGTQLSHESLELVFAAYDVEWLVRSAKFKRSLIIFIERTKIPLQITGLKILPLSLATFTSIMKSAYSFFTLIRNFQEQ